MTEAQDFALLFLSFPRSLPIHFSLHSLHRTHIFSPSLHTILRSLFFFSFGLSLLFDVLVCFHSLRCGSFWDIISQVRLVGPLYSNRVCVVPQTMKHGFCLSCYAVWVCVCVCVCETTFLCLCVPVWVWTRHLLKKMLLFVCRTSCECNMKCHVGVSLKLDKDTLLSSFFPSDRTIFQLCIQKAESVVSVSGCVCGVQGQSVHWVEVNGFLI